MLEKITMNNQNIDRNIPSTSNHDAKQPLYVTVTDPIHIQEGSMNKYTAYHVTVLQEGGTGNNSGTGVEDSHMNYFSSGGGSVLRRYSDFCWLVERIRVERGGAIVPPLPEKQSVNRFAAGFVAQRGAQLQVFLNEVFTHPELQDSDCVNTFLRADDGTFALAKRQTEHSGESKASALLASASNPISKWFGGNQSNGNHIPRQQSQEDLIMMQIGSDLKEWESQIKSVLTHSHKLVKKSKEVANGYFEMV